MQMILFIHANAVTGNGKQAATLCEFTQNDPLGLIMAIMGMGIVFTALLLIYLIFSNTPKLFTQSFKTRLRGLFSRRREQEAEALPESPSPAADLTGEVNAAIAAAIHLYRSELHDMEETVLTIKKVSRTYSPWSSKIYGLRNVMGRN